MSTPVYTLRKIKTFQGREGYGLNAELCRDGKFVCFVIDDANGGCYSYDWQDHTLPRTTVKVRDWQDGSKFHEYMGTHEEAAFQAYILTLPKLEACDLFPEGGRYQDADGFIAKLADEAEMDKKIKGYLKKSLCFVLKGDKPNGGFRTVTLKANQTLERAKQYVAGKYGDESKGTIFLNDATPEVQRKWMVSAE